MGCPGKWEHGPWTKTCVTPPTTRPILYLFYPRFAGDARDVGGMCGDVENDAGDAEGLIKKKDKSVMSINLTVA